MIGLHEAAANPSSGAHEVVPKQFSRKVGQVWKGAQIRIRDEKRLVKKCYIWRKVGGFFVRVLYFKQRSEPPAGRLPAGDRAGGYNSYYFNVIIYLSIYELGARHSYR